MVKRTGLIGTKIGNSSYYDKTGKSLPVTILKISDCIALSKHIKNHFDSELDDYNLNVSSAGLLSPLKTHRQFLKNFKRKMKVKSKAGSDYVGNLVNVGEEDITLEWSSREPKTVGKGKITVVKNKLIAFDQIEKANLIVEFNKL